MNTTTRASAMPEVPTVAKATPRPTKAFVEALTPPELKARLMAERWLRPASSSRPS